MPIMPIGEWDGVEGKLRISDHHVQLNVEIEGYNYYAALVMEGEESIVGLRDWLIDYCREGKLGEHA